MQSSPATAPATTEEMDRLDLICRTHTAFATFEAMFARPYVPSIRLDLMGSRDGLILAAAFNIRALCAEAFVSAKRQDGSFRTLQRAEVARRAARYNKPLTIGDAA